MIATTPPPPYYAVIFTSLETTNTVAYLETAKQMEELAKLQSGYLGLETAREELGITVSYWKDLESIRNWKMNSEHSLAQKMGKEKWYAKYKTRICKVERDYKFGF